MTVSEMRRDELAELHGVDKNVIHVIPNGIDPAGFLNLDPQSWSFITRLNLATASPILLLPVRITPRKNIELAIHTLAALRRTFPAARLLVTGPLGPHNPANRDYFEQLRALRKELRLMDAVHFLAEMTDAFLPDRVISDFYRLADALLLPSREEGFGLPLLEAGLAGVPVFCADIPTLKSLGLENAHYFSPDERPEQVAGVIADHLHASRVFKLRASVKIHYTWERVYADKIAPLLV